jgi:O-succinylbenzoate synthase
LVPLAAGVNDAWAWAAADVARVRLWPVAVPLVRPIRASHGTETVRRSTLVEVELLGGSVGWGECVALSEPTYTAEWAEGAFVVLARFAVPRLFAGLTPLGTHPMAGFALRSALADARLRAAGENLAVSVGGRPGAALARAQVLGRPAGVEALVAAVDPAVALVKIKVEPGWDAEPLAGLRAAYPDLALAADANGAYPPGADLGWSEGLAYLEEPGGSAGLRCPLALDESIRDGADLARAARVGAVVNLKPARLGDPSLVAAAPAGSFVGGMYELGVGRAVALAFASRLDTPTDLGPSAQYVAVDVTEPLICDPAGRIVVPSGPGMGVEVRWDVVRSYLVDQPVELRP